MSQTVFYTPVDGKVAGALNARKGYYMSENRSEGAHNWLHKKIAFATATASNPMTGRSRSLAISRKGGLKKGLYKTEPSGDGSSKHFPKPHLTSVKISAEGDFGSIRKCELAFTVYTITDLDDKQPFFDLGADIGLTWGWVDAGGAGGPDGRFQGKIYNFTYSVNAQGGFDCITYGMEEGINILSGNVDAPTEEAAEIIDKLGNIIKSNNILETAKGWQAAAEGMTEGVTPEGIGVVQFPSDWGTNPTKPESGGEAPTAPTGTPEAQYYISLEAIIKLINKLAFDNAPKAFGDTGVAITCNGEVTKGLVPQDTNRLVSANPIECLFPGYGTYSPDRTFTFADYDAAFIGGDLSKSMISMKWFIEAFSKVGKKDNKTGKAPDSTIGTFLQDLFTLLFKNSGDRFKLTAVSKPGSKSGTEILIIDANYIDTESVAPYSLTAVKQGSIVRSMSLTAKVPSEMATTAMIANQSGFTSNKSKSVYMAGEKGKAQEKVPETLEAAKKNMADQFVTPDKVKALESALRRDQSGDAGAVNGKEAIPFPLDFSATIDGVEGFVFGNLVTSNYLPAVYQSSRVKIAFTVTKVNHNIAGGDWTTTLNTVCRIIS